MTTERFKMITGFPDSPATRIVRRIPAAEKALVALGVVGTFLGGRLSGSEVMRRSVGVVEEVTREHGFLPGTGVGMVLVPSGDRGSVRTRLEAAASNYRRRTAA